MAKRKLSAFNKCMRTQIKTAGKSFTSAAHYCKFRRGRRPRRSR